MLHQSIFNLDGTNPQTLDLHHVIGAADVPVIAIGIAIVLITGAQPMSLDGVFAFVVLVPVGGTDGIALNKEIANLIVGQWPSVFVHNEGFVTGKNLPTRSGTHGPRTVANEHVPRFRGADGVQDLYVKAFPEATVDSSRQRLS